MAVGWWSNCPSLTGSPLLHASKCITCFYHTMFKSIPDSFRNCSASQTPQAGTEPAHKLRQKQQPQNNTKKTTQKSHPHKTRMINDPQVNFTREPWKSECCFFGAYWLQKPRIFANLKRESQPYSRRLIPLIAGRRGLLICFFLQNM